jgi:OOP family OmpA-OmpF porin
MRWIPLLALLVLPGIAGAQPQGHYWWVSPMAGWIHMSNDTRYPADSLKDSPAFGGRLGYSFADRWSLEFGGAFASAKEAVGAKRSVSYTDVGGMLDYSLDNVLGGHPYLGAGFGWNSLTSSGFDALTHTTFTQQLGWHAWLNDRTAFRLEFRNVMRMPKGRTWGDSHQWDQQYWAGLTWGLGGKPLDTDGDGVPDKRDKCPGTPTGATVDATGCPLDSDHDGVYDGIDQCPNTPAGATVDARGCPKDSDGDGVYDGIDQCPDTPKGATVDAKGCPIDSDGDGVPDGIDQCANTPAGAKVDARGCPIDSDGDGVPDGIDQCPGTAAGAKVDDKGCPIVVTEKETELFDTGMIRLQGVNFETGKSELLPESLPILDQVGPILLKWPQLQIEVGGHTDSRGPEAKNQVLSEARANAVRDYLLQKYPGIQPSQLTAKGYGESKPMVPNNSALNMAKNRRVEFVVLNKDVLKKVSETRKVLQK